VLAATSIAGCSATETDASKDPPNGADGVSKIVVGAGPCCLVATNDGIWVMNHRDKTVQLVDPDRNKPGESISVDPYNKWISAGDKMLMEGERGAAIFDPATDKVRPIAGVSSVRGLAFDPKTQTMWIGSAVDGSLTEVDAKTGRVVDTTLIDGLDSGGDIVHAGQHLWIANFDGELLKIDLDRHRVATRLRPFAGALGHVVSAGGWLWAVSTDEPALLRMDPDTGEVTRRIATDFAGTASPGFAAPPDGTLWLASADRIERLDPKTGDTLDSYAVPLSDDTDLATYYAMGGVVVGFGSIWTTIFDDTYTDDAVVRLERG
jgi:DNA-binding beta-propeller fold protein YncE